MVPPEALHGRPIRPERTVLRVTDINPRTPALCGNSNMLAVMQFIANLDEPRFSTPQVVAATGVDNTLVHPLLARLKKGEVIDQVGHVPGERTLLFERRSSPYWELVRRLAEDGPNAD